MQPYSTFMLRLRVTGNKSCSNSCQNVTFGDPNLSWSNYKNGCLKKNEISRVITSVFVLVVV